MHRQPDSHYQVPFQRHAAAANCCLFRWQSLWPAASCSQPAGSGGAAAASEPVTPARGAWLAKAAAACQERFIPGVWPTWVCIYISEGGGLAVGGEKGHGEPWSSSDASGWWKWLIFQRATAPPPTSLPRPLQTLHRSKASCGWGYWRTLWESVVN